jgi:adenosylcobyric acid synthase
MVDILDGCVSANGNVIGTYIHGIFDNDEFRSGLINYLRLKKGLKSSDGCHVNSKSIKEHRYNELSDIVRENMDMNIVYNMLKLS